MNEIHLVNGEVLKEITPGWWAFQYVDGGAAMEPGLDWLTQLIAEEANGLGWWGRTKVSMAAWAARKLGRRELLIKMLLVQSALRSHRAWG